MKKVYGDARDWTVMQWAELLSRVTIALLMIWFIVIGLPALIFFAAAALSR